ncbi:uncharacterized protein LOC126369166 [Pectinophora gossypiella]|nr:uncharacterized protein LOC126369166 [Pectinophora gossypiella]
MLFLIWSVVLLVALALYFRQLYSFFHKRGVKNELVMPFFGDMFKVVLHMEHTAESISKTYKRFPEERFVGRFEFIRPLLVVRDIELIKKISIKDFEHFLDHRVFIDSDNDPLFGRNLFSLRGQEWKDMRSTLSPAFTSSKMKLMLPFMAEVGDQLVHTLKDSIKKSNTPYLDLDTKDLCTRYANDVIATCTFGLKVDSLSEPDNNFYKQGLIAATFKFKQLLLFFLGSAFPWIVKRLNIKLFSEQTSSFFKNLVLQTMEDRETRNILRPDMIHLLMEAKKGKLTHEDKAAADPDAGFATVEESSVGKKEVNKVWSDTDLVAQAILFFIGGFETAASAITFLLYELAVNPDVQDKLVQEIKDFDSKNEGKLDYNDIQRMTYMDMVVSENLRLWTPAVMMDRICTKDCNLGKPNDKATEDYIIHKGEGLMIPVWSIQRDPQYFPDPEKFDPERFSEENKHKIKPFTYMPFGLGPRNCIGSRFALCKVKVLVYQLLRHMEVVPGPKTRIPVQLDPETFNLRMKGGHWLRFKVRQIMLLLIWVVVLVVALMLYLRHVYSYFDRKGVATDNVSPFFTSTLKIIFRIEHFTDIINKSYSAYRGERFVGKFEFLKPVLLLRDLELIKKVTVKDFEHFLDHTTTVDPNQDPVFGRNLFSLKGQEWKDMRSTLSPAFTSSKMKLMLPFMVEVGDQMVFNLKKSIKENNNPFLDVDAKDLTTRFANDVIATCAFGLKVDSHADKDNEFYKQGLMTTTFKISQLIFFLLSVALPKLGKLFKIKLFTEKTRNFFENLVTQTMEDREKRNIIRPDMIHLLMEAKKGKLTHDEKASADPDAGFATVEESAVGKKEINRVWSDTDLIAQAVLFFVAGFETVSSAMTFLLYELAVNPDVQERLAQEIRETAARNAGKFDYNDIQRMTYMDMVVSEVLRLWPPAVATDRLCVKNYNMGKPNDKATQDFILRKGEGLQIPMWAIHRDPEYFPNPDKFDPERFSEENKHNIKPFTYFPFGLGPRNCIGSRFALCEVKVMIYQLLLHMEVTPGPKTTIPAQLDPASFNLRLKGGHWLRFKIRE